MHPVKNTIFCPLRRSATVRDNCIHIHDKTLPEGHTGPQGEKYAVLLAVRCCGNTDKSRTDAAPGDHGDPQTPAAGLSQYLRAICPAGTVEAEEGSTRSAVLNIYRNGGGVRQCHASVRQSDGLAP